MWVGKSYEFCAAHYIPEHEKCGRMHGHSYKVEVLLEGPIMTDGFVIDFHKLNTIVKKITEPLDHNVLNEFLINPTCERLSQYICKQLSYTVPSHIREVKVRIQEGPFGGWAECHHNDLHP